MIKTKILFATFIGTFFYTLISLIAGRNGQICYSHLKDEKIRISLQTSQIESINKELNFTLTALKNDKDLIRCYAHKLHYVQDNEKIVKIRGLKPFQNNLYDPGTVLRHTEEKYIPENILKAIGIIFFLLSFMIFILIDILKGNSSFKIKKEKTVIQGIPVYEMPQI